MANPISTARRAALGLSKMKKAPTGNLPTLREPQPTVIERTLDKPVDRRTFLEGAQNAAAAASNIDKLGALGDLIPEVATKAVEVAAPAVPSSFFKIKEMLASIDVPLDWVLRDFAEGNSDNMDIMAEEYDLSPGDMSKAEDILINYSDYLEEGGADLEEALEDLDLFHEYLKGLQGT